jgi:diguanylate cyclase (GGDEF)-like protein
MMTGEHKVPAQELLIAAQPVTSDAQECCVIKLVRDMSLGTKILMALAVSAGSAVLVMLLVVSIGSLLRLQHHAYEQMTALADVTGQNSKAALIFGDVTSAMETLAPLRSNTLVASAAIYDRNGNLFAALPAFSGAPRFQSAAALATIADVHDVRNLISGTANLMLPITKDGENIGAIFMVADLVPLRREWLTEVTLMLTAAVAAFSIALVLAVYMRRLIAGPLHELSTAVAKVADNQDYSLRVKLCSDDEIGQLMGRFNDMLGQIEHRDGEIRQLAFYDPLTRLPNRRLLRDRLKQALAACTRKVRHGALLFIDMDNFKTLNDTLGHDFGDMLLQQVALRLSACVREGDTVARLGGDEFVVMLEDLGKNLNEAIAQTEAAGEKVLVTLNQVYLLANQEYYSTPSIGITLFANDDENIDDLLKRADLAMYQAKAAGRNTLRFFDPAMQAAVTARAALDNDLREALREKQFVLYYQPQVDQARRITGAEALLRWHHPQRGLVSPADFIPLAEETGLILPLGQWVLETACTQLVRWAAHPETSHLTMAVNVSAHQFSQNEFADQVLAVLKNTGANPRKLKLELTESLLVDDVEDTIIKMATLKAEGVAFSLDDFGTGYSSLSYLKRLPLDQLKIDQSFVRDILSDPNDAAIARTIVGLAGSMGLAVIAEGVETEAQLNLLAANGCHAYQGYLFSRPQPVHAFEDLVRQEFRARHKRNRPAFAAFPAELLAP